MSSLPTPRELLSSLVTSLSAPTHQGLPSAPNPLRHVPSEKTALLSALHVLFPPLLLPALDLLDRGLVTRVHRKKPTGSRGGEQEPEGKGSRVEESGDGTPARSQEAGFAGAGEGQDPQRGGFHVVRSLASTMKRREGGYYVVFLDAWNCTCPTFAFDAFPPVTSTSGFMMDGKCESGGGAAEAEECWAFGGVSTDGRGFGASIPCCKHLLACVLAEQWADILGTYVPVKALGKGEIAGLVADV